MAFELSTFSYEQFAQEFLHPIKDKTLQYLVFQAYRNMVSGMPLSQIFSGRRYVQVRDTMLNTLTNIKGTVLYFNLAERDTRYVPLAFPITVPRIFPVGHYVEFDIYNTYPYVKKGEETTVQIRFRMWLPLGSFLSGDELLTLFVTFYPIAEQIFRRINVDASLEAMEAEQDVVFTIGLHVDTIKPLHNISTVTVIITKVKSTEKHKSKKQKANIGRQYIYDFLVRYQYSIDDLGGNMYRVSLCHFQILKAISCTYGDDIYQFYRKMYYDKYGAEYTWEQFSNILNACPFTWKLYRPARVSWCRSLVDVNTLI